MDTAVQDRTLFRMPSLGADMDDGRVTEWLVHPGDRVERGQIVVVVETDKSDIEVEVFEPGTVLELLVAEGERVPVGTPIARIDHDGGGPTSPVPAADAPDERPCAPASERPPAAPAPVDAAVPEPVRVVSPVIRHLAEELHVDAGRLRGTGPGGRISRADVERAAQHERRRPITPRARRLMTERRIDPITYPGEGLVTGDDVLDMPTPAVPVAPRPASSEEDRPSRAELMRRKIADLMTMSWTTIPHYHVTKRLDLTAAAERLRLVNEDRPLADRIVMGSLLLAAASRAARAVPGCNGWWRDRRFEQADDVHLGVVLSLRGGGIMVPTIQHADTLAPSEVMARLTELVQRARQGRLRASDMTEATITVTNLGDLGADAVTGVIHPPQVALVGFGAVHDEVWPDGGAVVVRPTVHASLAGDHRATDGLTGSRYLAQLQTLLDGSLLEECT